jgi:acetylornithine deacetylase/succinyl-diaminopimelate desuccinylase-like protein
MTQAMDIPDHPRTESAVSDEIRQVVSDSMNVDRLVSTACALVAIPSVTGSELPCAEYLITEMNEAGLSTELQEVEPGRANAVGRLAGSGGGPSLMFNGHLDTSYSGEEAWLNGPGFKPEPLVRDAVIYGLGIMNMKGSVACYIEAVRMLRDAGVSLGGDLVVAGVAGEIETAEWGEEFRGPRYRGYGAGTKHLMATGTTTDACILGEPTEEQIVLGHWGTLWVRLSTTGPFFHTAFASGRSSENSVRRMAEVLDAIDEWRPTWETLSTYQDRPGVMNIGAIRGGFPWRLSRTPHRTDVFLDLRVPPTMSTDDAEGHLSGFVTELRATFPDYGIDHEVFVAVPGAEIDDDHPLITAIDTSHRHVWGESPSRDYVRWGSDASTLTQHGISAVNYGPISSALPGPDGESVPIESLTRIANSYALSAIEFCGVTQ